MSLDYESVQILHTDPETYLDPRFDLTHHISLNGNLWNSIGHGGFSDVLPATLDGREVAAKIIRPDPMASYTAGRRSIIQRMDSEREMSIWRLLCHPNILPFLGYCRCDEGRIALISPWMGAGTVSDYLVKYPNTDRLPLVGGIANGLAYMHGRCVVHGDIKSANILVDTTSGNPRALFCDFGLSHVADSKEHLFNAHGTTAYMAPELHLTPTSKLDTFSGESTFASDVWS